MRRSARLIGGFVAFYREQLFNPHWGEQVTFRPRQHARRRHGVPGPRRAMQADAVWQPFFDWVADAAATTSRLQAPPFIAALPARHFWDAAFLQANAPDCRAERRPARRARGQRVLGRQSRRGRAGSSTATNRLAAGVAARAGQPARAWSMRCSPHRATGASRCTSTRAWPARRPRRSRRRATRR